MQKEPKKQFSLSVMLRIFLVLIVVISIGIFANSVMKYNALLEEQQELERVLNLINENIEELEERLGSGEQVQQLLNDYESYQQMIESGSEIGMTLEEIEALKTRLRELINDSENKDYIVRVAKERLHLYFPDEEIYYNDQNQ